MNNFFESKVILVTGGTGSIGSEIVHQLLKMSPRVVRIFSRDEYKQFCIQQELGNRSDVRYLLGDVREGSRLLRAAEGVDIIFHCAAYKHVPFCEYNPFEAVKTNVIGTQNVIEAALAQGVRKVLLISTDKAASPLNVMGATKLLAERLMSSTMHSIGSHNTILASVRFGNVLGSRGSVIPLFRDQIAKGGPLTITHPEMTRFFMSIPQAVKLVFSAAELMKGGELFILKMPAARVGDIADVLIEVLAP
jgi:FlaA1/EpsC-like NDP-sugar epimerase